MNLKLNRKILFMCLMLLVNIVVVFANTTKKNTNDLRIENKEVAKFLLNYDIRPQDNFYNFVNGNWEKNSKIPADSGSWGAMDELSEILDNQSLSILDGILKEDYEKNSDGAKIQALYKVYTNYSEREKLKFGPIETIMKKIDTIVSVDNLQDIIIDLYMTDQFSNPFYDFGIDADMLNSNQNSVYYVGGGTGLNSDFYQKKSEKNSEIIENYTLYVKEMFKLYGYSEEDANKSAEKIIKMERLISNYKLTNEEVGDPSLMYNPLNMKDIKDISKNIDLEKYLVGVKVKTDLVILTELKYFKNLDSILNEENLDMIKEFLKFTVLNNTSGLLHEEVSKLSFDFYGKYLGGKKEEKSKEKKALYFVNAVLAEPFGKLYVEKYFSNEKKESALEMISYIKRATKIRIKNVEWLTEETKQKALEKLDTLNLKVGYPDVWEDYSNLKIEDTNNLIEVSSAVSKWTHEKELKKIGKPVDKTEWSMSPQTVNAYYNPLFNEIVFPAAILQEPFFYANGDPGVNFGGIGAVIAHEITHGFDSSGAQFDKDGNMNNWWRQEDLEKFNSLSKKLVEQFNKYEPIKGHFVNGEFTLNENIADLGGLNISYEALQLYLKEKGAVETIDGQTQEQRFFISWATGWRTISTDESLISLMSMDNHTPSKVRATAPLKNMDAFYEAFDINEGDKEFKHKEDRITIW